MDLIKETKDLGVIAETIRLLTLETLGNLGFGHVGGAMSIVETLAVLYSGELKCDPSNPGWEQRDRLVMSKGHAGPALYATLALRGYFPKEMLVELNQGGGRLPSHCDMNKTPGVDMTTGSLGQGISSAIGIALGARLNKADNTTYLVMGDGELDEGQVWEGVMFASHHKLGGLIAFVDWNKQQLDGYTEDVMKLGNIEDKFKSFGWQAVTVNGHDPKAIKAAVEAAKAIKDVPSAIILDTKKGYGCNFAEDVEANHHMNFTKEQMDGAIEVQKKRLEEAKQAANNGKGV
ncbi:MAG: transketolase [Oscillospiraceae bacterium]|nr:transketolase [Oscillospiraceae bacterium]